MFSFEKFEVLATECMEGSRKIVEAAHTKLSRATINKEADVSNCYYQILK